MKKSVKVVGKIVDFVYIIKDIDVDKVTLEKYNAKCATDIVDAWGIESSGQTTFMEPGEQILEISLEDKISNVTIIAKAPVVEKIAKMGGKMIKDIVVERAKRGKKVYLSDIILFKEVAPI